MGGGGGLRDIFGSKILTKRDFLGSIAWKTQGFFGSHRTAIFLGIVQLLFINLNQHYCKHNLLSVWDFFGYAENVGIFWVDKILE